MNRGPKPIPPEIRFWKFVNKTDSCWIWTGSKLPSGHGRLNERNKVILAHRLSWEIHNGPIPEGQCALHNCPGEDNPSCVNPKHLWIGTKAQNNTDASNKGQTSRGEERFNSKLTEEKVRWIRQNLSTPPRNVTEISKKWGVSLMSIWDVIHGKTWKHVQ